MVDSFNLRLLRYKISSATIVAYPILFAACVLFVAFIIIISVRDKLNSEAGGYMCLLFSGLYTIITGCVILSRREDLERAESVINNIANNR